MWYQMKCKYIAIFYVLSASDRQWVIDACRVLAVQALKQWNKSAPDLTEGKNDSPWGQSGIGSGCNAVPFPTGFQNVAP